MFLKLLFFAIFSQFLTLNSSLYANNQCKGKISLPLYFKSFGKCTDPSIIYLHGGPSHDSSLFEFTTAEKLSNLGYYVIVYDRRCTGRSPITQNCNFTFKEAVSDISDIISELQLTNITLLGHSFGGSIGLEFLKNYPTKVKNLILSGTPISYHDAIHNILLKAINQEIPRLITEASLSKNQHLVKLYQSSLETTQEMMNILFDSNKQPLYANFNEKNVSYVFNLALNLGYYTPNSISNEAKKLYEIYRSQPPIIYQAQEFKGFLNNEHYLQRNEIELLSTNKDKVYAIYGSEDGLHSPNNDKILSEILGSKHRKIKSASHNVFIDQQMIFLDELKNLL